MTTFYYYSVNHQSGLQRNTFSKLSYILLIHQNVPQIMSFHLRLYDGYIGQNVLKLWRQESWPFGPGWPAHITRIRWWTFRLPWIWWFLSHHNQMISCGISFFGWKLKLSFLWCIILHKTTNKNYTIGYTLLQGRDNGRVTKTLCCLQKRKNHDA